MARVVSEYISIIYDLTHFGIFNIKNAIVTSDLDDGITIEVSFDGGVNFILVTEVNKKFNVLQSKGKIQVRVKFYEVEDSDIYTVKTVGYFSNLELGTTLNFTKNSTGENFATNIAENGRYSINLPRGYYEVWIMDNGDKVVLLDSFNPETVIQPTKRLDKENSIEMFIRDVDWIKYAVFDTFDDTNKIYMSSAIIDPEGDLSDGKTNRKCRYWGIGFE
jgi:hypothetical protein